MKLYKCKSKQYFVGFAHFAFKMILIIWQTGSSEFFVIFSRNNLGQVAQIAVVGFREGRTDVYCERWPIVGTIPPLPNPPSSLPPFCPPPGGQPPPLSCLSSYMFYVWRQCHQNCTKTTFLLFIDFGPRVLIFRFNTPFHL